MDASRRASGALTRAARKVLSRVSLPVAGRSVTGSGINAGVAANAEEIKVTDIANRSISSIVPHYAISGNLRIRVPLASKIALPIAGAIPTMGVSPAPAD